MRFIALLLLALASFGAVAQDIPGRVGRVSFTEGSVAIYQDPDIGWETAYVNSPVTSENSLWTEPGARAEVRVSAVALRLDEATQLDVSRLDDDEMIASIVRGSIQLRIRHNDYDSRISFDTPEARFTITRVGTYRIDVDPDEQETRLAVFTGEATIETAQGARAIPAGRMVRISNGDFRFERASTNAFDRWAQTRDRDWVESKAPQYVSTFMTGYEELDPYGQWIQEPEYGALWMPTHVSADWVPYRYGHWSYVRPWGWTWIDDQRWGYAPFHYGRWVHVRNRWCWYPGERIARPAWAPALVAWVGGSGWNVNVSSGPVLGWYPLAPHEAYRPWYRANDRYLSRVNHNVDRDRRRDDRGRDDRRRDAHDWNRERAITAVPRENLIARRPVQQSMVRIAADAARSAPVVQPQAVIPNTNELQRIRTERARTAPASLRSQRTGGASTPAAAPSAPAQPAPGQQRGNAPIAREERGDRGDRGDRGNRGQANQAAPAKPAYPITAPQIAPGAPVAPIARPNFSRPQAPAPAPAPAATPQAQPAPAPQGNPLSRGSAERGNAERGNAERGNAERGNPERGNADRGRERAQQQQQQQEAQRQQQQQQQQQQEAQRQQQQQQQEAQRRAAESQRAQQQQQQQQETQRRAAESQRAQQQEAQRRAAEQRAQQQQQQHAQQQEAQRRAAEQRAQQQQQQQAQQQEAQRRAAEQRAQQQAQQQEAQRRAAEQRAQQQQQRQQQQQQQQQQQRQQERPQPQAQPQAQPQGNPAQRGGDEHRGRDKERPDNDDKPGKGR
jgi:hypothetical protein